MSEFYQYVDN